MRMNYQKTICGILVLLVINSCKKDDKIEAQYPAYFIFNEEGKEISIEGMARYSYLNQEFVIQTAEVLTKFQQRETKQYVLDVSNTAKDTKKAVSTFHFTVGTNTHVGSIKLKNSGQQMIGFVGNHTTSSLLNMYTYVLEGHDQVQFPSIVNHSLDNVEPVRLIEVNDGYILVGAKINGNDKNAVVIKFSPTFVKIWEKEYGGAGNEMAMDAVDLCDNNYAILAYTYSKGAGDRDIWYLKIDRNGYLITDTTYGGAGYEEPQRMITRGGCELYIAGHSSSFGAPEHDGYLLKINDKGGKIWEKTFGTQYHDGFNAVVNIPNTKTFIAVGRSMQGVAQPEDIFLVCFDEDGKELWRKKYGDPNYTELPQDIIADEEYYYLACNRVDVAGKTHGVFIKDKLP